MFCSYLFRISPERFLHNYEFLQISSEWDMSISKSRRIWHFAKKHATMRTSVWLRKPCRLTQRNTLYNSEGCKRNNQENNHAKTHIF